MSVAASLGAFVAGSRWDEVDEPVRHAGRRSLLNFLGGAVGVAATPPVEMLVAVLRPLAGPAQATLLGRPERFDMMTAAFVNAVAANLLDYDDTHLDTVIHPTAPVAPALLALAEARGIGGAAVLHALLLGMEVECRLGLAVSPGHYARGWHITATCGVFGAAAGSARLLGLDATRTAHALGIAASQAAGVVENLPSAAKNVGVGNAARHGLFAALLAEAGCEAAPHAIEGRLGWARASGDALDAQIATRDLGRHWEAARNTLKPYPAGIVFHPVIDACLALRRDGVRPADVRSVMVRGPALLLERGDRAVANERDARVSIHHSVACALLHGAAGLREFEATAVFAPQASALRGIVRAEVDPTIPVGAAEVTVELVDGSRRVQRIDHARGSEANPLSDGEVEAKVRDLADRSGVRDVDRMIADAWAVDQRADLRPLMAAASARTED